MVLKPGEQDECEQLKAIKRWGKESLPYFRAAFVTEVIYFLTIKSAKIEEVIFFIVVNSCFFDCAGG